MQGNVVALGMGWHSIQVKTQIFPNNGRVIRDVIKKTVCINFTFCTDKYLSYIGIPEYWLRVVCHSAKQFVDGMGHTNGIEIVRMALRQGIYGIRHSLSRKHLQRYLGGFVFRLNSGRFKNIKLERIDALARMRFGKLIYINFIGVW